MNREGESNPVFRLVSYFSSRDQQMPLSAGLPAMLGRCFCFCGLPPPPLCTASIYLESGPTRHLLFGFCFRLYVTFGAVFLVIFVREEEV